MNQQTQSTPTMPASGPTPMLLDFLIARHPALFSIEELVPPAPVAPEL